MFCLVCPVLHQMAAGSICASFTRPTMALRIGRFLAPVSNFSRNFLIAVLFLWIIMLINGLYLLIVLSMWEVSGDLPPVGQINTRKITGCGGESADSTGRKSVSMTQSPYTLSWGWPNYFSTGTLHRYHRFNQVFTKLRLYYVNKYINEEEISDCFEADDFLESRHDLWSFLFPCNHLYLDCFICSWGLAILGSNELLYYEKWVFRWCNKIMNYSWKYGFQ